MEESKRIWARDGEEGDGFETKKSNSGRGGEGEEGKETRKEDGEECKAGLGEGFAEGRSWSTLSTVSHTTADVTWQRALH